MNKELEAKTNLSHYRIVSKIGAGGMGEVYRARDTRLDRKVAIKVLPTDFANDADRRKAFEQEARATSALNQPNIVTIYDIVESDDTPLMATEYIKGETLRHHLQHSRLTKSSGSCILIKLLAQPYQNLGEKNEYTSS